MATELRDDAFDLEALVLEDLPFAAYYPVGAVAVPTPPPPIAPSRGGVLVVPRRRRRQPALRFTHVAAGGVAVGGAAAISVTAVCSADGGVAVGGAAGLSAAHTWRADGGVALSGEAEVAAQSPFRERLPGLLRDDDDLLLNGLL